MKEESKVFQDREEKKEDGRVESSRKKGKGNQGGGKVRKTDRGRKYERQKPACDTERGRKEVKRPAADVNSGVTRNRMMTRQNIGRDKAGQEGR